MLTISIGTGQDSLGVDAQNPSNIVRLARAISPNAWIEHKKKNGDEEVIYYEEIEQIVYYQAGVGTFEGNTFFGGQ